SLPGAAQRGRGLGAARRDAPARLSAASQFAPENVPRRSSRGRQVPMPMAIGCCPRPRRGATGPPWGGTMTVDQIIAQLDSLQIQGVSFERLLENAVHGVHQLDSRFHWTGIYELFPDDVLRLGPFVGAPTEHCFIGVGKGVCGSAVAEKRNMNIPDVSRHANYL